MHNAFPSGRPAEPSGGFTQIVQINGRRDNPVKAYSGNQRGSASGAFACFQFNQSE